MNKHLISSYGVLSLLSLSLVAGSVSGQTLEEQTSGSVVRQALAPEATRIEELLKPFIQNDPSVLEARRLLESAHSRRSHVGLNVYPSLNISGNIGLNSLDDPSTRSDGTSPLERTQREFGTELSYNLFNGFADAAEVRSADANVAAHEAQLKLVVLNTLAKGLRVYNEMLRDTELVDIVDAWKRDIVEVRDQELERLEGGEVSRVDEIRIKSRLNDVLTQEIQIFQQLKLSQAAFVESFGYFPDNESFTNLDVLTVSHNLDVGHALSIMDEYHPAIEAKRYEAQSLEANIDFNLSSYYPKVDVLGSYNYSINTSASEGASHTYFVGLDFNWALNRGIFPGYAISDDTNAYLAGIERIKVTQREQTFQLRSLFGALQAGQNAQEINNGLHDLAIENLNVQRELFASGVVNSMDFVTQAINTRYLTHINVVRQEYANQVTAIQLLAAIGMLLPTAFGIDEMGHDFVPEFASDAEPNVGTGAEADIQPEPNASDVLGDALEQDTEAVTE